MLVALVRDEVEERSDTHAGKVPGEERSSHWPQSSEQRTHSSPVLSTIPVLSLSLVHPNRFRQKREEREKKQARTKVSVEQPRAAITKKKVEEERTK